MSAGGAGGGEALRGEELPPRDGKGGVPARSCFVISWDIYWVPPYCVLTVLPVRGLLQINKYSEG